MDASFFTGLAFLFAAGFLAVCGMRNRKKRKKLLAYTKTEATIVEYLCSREDDISDYDENRKIVVRRSQTLYDFKISYMAKGAVVENKHSDLHKYNIKEKIEIKYNPSSPKEFYLNDRFNRIFSLPTMELSS
jgi:hypothetical protein